MVPTWLEKAASASLWSDCKWIIVLVVPCGAILGFMIWMNQPSDYHLPLFFTIAAGIALTSVPACVFFIPYAACAAVNRLLMAKHAPGQGWARRAVAPMVVAVLTLLWLGAIITPFLFGLKAGIAGFLLSVLIAAAVCAAVTLIELLIGIPLLLLFTAIIRRKDAKK